MNVRLSARFLAYFRPKNNQKGMTEVDWLVLIILAVAAAVGFPFLLSTRSKTPGAEGRNNVGALNRAQQAYFLEKSTLTDSIPELGVGIKNPTNRYEYFIHKTPLAVFNYAIARQARLKSYMGVVVVGPAENADDDAEDNVFNHVSYAILCETNEPGVQPLEPIVKNGFLHCHPTMKDLGYPDGLAVGIPVGEDWEKTNQALELVAAENYDEAMQLAETVGDRAYKQKILEALEATNVKHEQLVK